MSEQNAFTTIPTKNLLAAVSAYKHDYDDIIWGELNIRVRCSLSLYSTFAFVDFVVKSCFDSDNGEYLPEAKSLAIDSAIIQYYTNLVLPNDAGEQYDLLCGTDLVEKIINAEHFDKRQFRSILEAIDSKINYLVNIDINRIKSSLDDVARGFEDITNSLSGMFDGIDNDTIKKMVTLFTSDSSDEMNLVDTGTTR